MGPGRVNKYDHECRPSSRFFNTKTIDVKGLERCEYFVLCLTAVKFWKLQYNF